MIELYFASKLFPFVWLVGSFIAFVFDFFLIKMVFTTDQKVAVPQSPHVFTATSQVAMKVEMMAEQPVEVLW